jgi:GGDEF domain-containing protein
MGAQSIVAETVTNEIVESTTDVNLSPVGKALKEKVELIYQLFDAHTPPPDTSKLHPSVAAKINDLPLHDRKEVLENATTHLEQAKENDGNWKSLVYWLDILRRNYYERTKTYLIPDKINTQAYLHSKLEEEIGLMCKKRNLDIMASRVGWAFLDTNALKGTNDVFGHDKGNLIIRKIARGLKSLVKIKTDDGSRIAIQCAIQSGDEYNLFLKSNKELTAEVIQIANDKIQNYLSSLKANGIIDMTNRNPEEVEFLKQKLKENNIDLEDKSNKFIISASCGISVLSETLLDIQIKEEDSYFSVLGKIKSRMERLAEDRAMKSKPLSKEKASQNALMAYLLSFRK